MICESKVTAVLTTRQCMWVNSQNGRLNQNQYMNKNTFSHYFQVNTGRGNI